jgi:hypothetical protein
MGNDLDEETHDMTHDHIRNTAVVCRFDLFGCDHR